MKDFAITLEGVEKLIKSMLKECRIKRGEKGYHRSKKFFKKYGFRYEEVLNMDVTFAAFLLPRLIYFRDNHVCIPKDYCVFDKDGVFVNEKQAKRLWTKDIDTMIEAFYLILKGHCEGSNEDEQKIIEEGLKLFSAHFQDLWC